MTGNTTAEEEEAPSNFFCRAVAFKCLVCGTKGPVSAGASNIVCRCGLAFKVPTAKVLVNPHRASPA